MNTRMEFRSPKTPTQEAAEKAPADSTSQSSHCNHRLCQEEGYSYRQRGRSLQALRSVPLRQWTYSNFYATSTTIFWEGLFCSLSHVRPVICSQQPLLRPQPRSPLPQGASSLRHNLGLPREMPRRQFLGFALVQTPCHHSQPCTCHSS